MLLLLFWGSSTFAALSQPRDIKEYLSTENYYMLNKAYQESESSLGDYDRVLCKVFLAYAFNQPDLSNTHINKLLAAYAENISDSMKSELHKIKVINHARLFQYRAALENSDYLVNHFARITDSADLAEIENASLIWKALADVPEQSASIRRSDSISLKKDKAGLWTIPVSTKYDKEDFIFDTGANFSVVCESTAKNNKWKTIPAGFEVGTATGKKVRANLAVADSLIVGHSVFRNVVFLLIPDEDLIVKPSPFFKYVIKGIIGLPVINEFREIEIHNDGFLYIPESVSTKGYKNFSIRDFTPVLYAHVKNEVLGFQFDTGARTSELFKNYLDKYPADFLTTTLTTKTTGGAGGTKKFDVYQLESFTAGIVNEMVTIKNIPVYKETKSRVEKFIVGNLGQDVFRQFKYISVNFQDMYIELVR